MTEPANTPAPWHVSGLGRQHGKLLIFAPNGPCLAMVNMFKRTEQEAAANAQLMAAAPELLEAIKAMIDQYDAANEVLPAYYQAKAAILKATCA